MTTLIANDTAQFSRCAPEKPLYCRVEDFVAHVIYDGRFLENFTADPERVADALGIALAPELVVGLQGRDHGLVLSEVTEKMTERFSGSPEPSMPEPVSFPFIVVGVAIIAVCVVDIITGQATIVDDPESERKV